MEKNLTIFRSHFFKIKAKLNQNIIFNNVKEECLSVYTKRPHNRFFDHFDLSFQGSMT